MISFEIDQTAANVDATFEPGDTILFGLEMTTFDGVGVEVPLDVTNFTISATAELPNHTEIMGNVAKIDAAKGLISIRFEVLQATANWKLTWVNNEGVKQTPVKGVIQIGASVEQIGGPCAC